MSNKVLLKKSSVASKVPTTSDLDYGELALNYADGKLYYKTSSNTISSIGGGSGSNSYTQIDRQSYTATSGQTTFSITYASSFVDVYVNGVHLSSEDYTASTGNTVVLSQACTAGDQVDLVGFSGIVITANTKTDGDLLVYNGSTGVWDNTSQASVTVGNANKWSTSRTLSYSGDATGSMSVDGSANASATLTLANSGVTAGSYGSSTSVPVITVDAKGRITSASTASISGSLTFTGDVTGTGSTGSSTALTLATVNSNVGTYNNVTVNAKGLVTSASNTTYALPADVMYIGTTSVALNRSSANLALTGISSVTLPGSTSGSVQIIPAAAVGTGTVLTIPATTGTIITSGDTGTVTNTMLAGSISTSKISGLATSATTDTTNASNITSGTLDNARLSAVPNNALANSSITVGTTAISLGSSSTTLTGLTSVTSTSFVGALTGNASTATTLATGRTIALTGDVTYTSGSFDGSGNVTGTATLANSGVTAGTYNNSATAVTPFTVDSKGRITSTGSAVTVTPAWSSITSTPTTISGYGITDAYTKNQVDAFLQGLDPKASVVVATTANITLSGTQTVDGVALSVGDRVLVKNQTTASQNGVYLVASSSWTRATDMDAWSEVPSSYVFVEKGTTYADTGWVCTADAGGTLDTTSITWVQFAGAGTYTGTSPVTVSGTTISLANSGVTAGSYGSSTAVPVLTIDALGRVTAASTASISGSLTFTGDVTGTGSTGSSTALTLAASGVTAGSGYNTFTVDSKGRVTSASTTSYLTSYTETDTLATVTGRGATTSTSTVFTGGLYSRKSQTTGDYTTAALATESYSNTSTGIAFHISGVVGKYLEMRTNGTLYWNSDTVWHSGNLTNLNQLTNGPGYITGYTETDTLATVTGRGATTGTDITLGSGVTTSYTYFGGTTSNYLQTSANGNLYVKTKDQTATYSRNLQLLTGNTTLAGSNSGGIIIKTGNATGGSGAYAGDISMNPGTSDGVAAVVSIYGGDSVSGTTSSGGYITIKGGSSTTTTGTTTANGGNVYIYGGDVTSSNNFTKNTGSIYIEGGGASGSGTITFGTINIGRTSGSSSYGTSAVNIGNSSITTTIDGTVKLPTVGTSGFVKLGAGGQLSADTNTYLTGTKVDSISATSPIVASASTGAVTLTHATSGVTAGTYNNVTVDAKGHVTSGSNVSYLTSYTETDTLATVTARGASTSTAVSLNGGLTVNRVSGQTSGFDTAVNDVYASMRVVRNSSYGSDGEMYIGYGNRASGNTRLFGGGSTSNEFIKYSTYSYEPGSFRAPIFYDSDDTSYYLNPNSTSVLNVIQVNGNSSFFGGQTSALSIENQTSFVRFAFNKMAFYEWDGNGDTFIIDNGYCYSPYSFRAPVFYDSNDTTYYLDANSTGTSLKVAGNIDLYARSASWAEGIRIRVPNTSNWGGIRWTRDRSNDDGNWALGYYGLDSTDDFILWANNGGDGGSVKFRITKAGTMTLNGAFNATSKSFLIDHPTKPGMKLRYGSLEGPENGVYIRGKLKGKNKIELPEYWTKLVDPDSITVTLTPIGKHQKLYVEDISDNIVTVANDGLFASEINCFFVVYGERVDIEKLEVEF